MQIHVEHNMSYLHKIYKYNLNIHVIQRMVNRDITVDIFIAPLQNDMLADLSLQKEKQEPHFQFLSSFSLC